MTTAHSSPVTKDKPPLTHRAARAVANARHAKDTALDIAGLPFARPAIAWKNRADERASKRTEENRMSVIVANVKHRDAMRDLRRDRKAHENARSEVKWWNFANGERRAAYAVVRDSRQLAREAGQVRKEAKRAYPITLSSLAMRCHAAHLIPTGVWAAVSDSYTATGAFAVSLAAATFNAAVATLGVRHCNTETVDATLEALHPSQAERLLLQRLNPTEWARCAEPRGLSDTVVARAELTEAGIQVKLTLNNQMTVPKLKNMEEQIRSVLHLSEKTRLEIRPGSNGGSARMTLRTRSAADGVSLAGWKPGDPWGIDTVTGDPVRVPLGRRMLVAGTSGAGKSWSMRPILAEASAYGDHRLVVIDAKRVEALNWSHRARGAVTRDEMLDVTDELIDEMDERLALIPRGEDVIQISPSRPRITVFVDEGAEVISLAKDVGSGEDKVEYSRILTNLRTLARMARAAEIIILWASQKVTISGEGRGLDSQIAAQITCRASLCVATAGESRVVFGDDAIEKGWMAHELPMPGVAMLRDSNTAKPHQIKTRAFSPKDVIALPSHPIWSRKASSTGATKADIEARKASEAPVDPWVGNPTVILGSDIETVDSGSTTRVAAADRDDQMIAALRENPCSTLSQLAKMTGANKNTVRRSLDRLLMDGLIRRDDDNCYHVVN